MILELQNFEKCSSVSKQSMHRGCQCFSRFITIHPALKVEVVLTLTSESSVETSKIIQRTFLKHVGDDETRVKLKSVGVSSTSFETAKFSMSLICNESLAACSAEVEVL